MSFQLPDLILESVIRDGLQALRDDSSPISDIFARLLTIMPQKYGQAEIDRIKTFVTTQEVPFKSNFPQSTSETPCITLQLLSDSEDPGLDRVDDFDDEVQTPITDPRALSKLVVIDGFTPTSYSVATGYVKVADQVDLEDVYAGLLFVDATGATFKIIGGFNNLAGKKQFGIALGSSPDISGPCSIKSSINYTQNTLRGVGTRQQIMIGIHTRERLLTSYLYTIVKFILYSRKMDLLSRGLQEPVISGADFNRDLSVNEPMFTRTFTVSGFCQDEWMSDAVVPIDHFEVQEFVQRAVASNGELDFEDQTVQVDDTNFQEE